MACVKEELANNPRLAEVINKYVDETERCADFLENNSQASISSGSCNRVELYMAVTQLKSNSENVRCIHLKLFHLLQIKCLLLFLLEIISWRTSCQPFEPCGEINYSHNTNYNMKTKSSGEEAALRMSHQNTVGSQE